MEPQSIKDDSSEGYLFQVTDGLEYEMLN